MKRIAIWVIAINCMVLHVFAIERPATPSLVHAVLANNQAIVSKLLSEKTDLSQRDELARSAVMAAILMNQPKLLKQLLVAGANASLFGFLVDEKNSRIKRAVSPLELAASIGSVEMTQLLLAHGAILNLNLDNGTPLHAAVRGKHIATARLLLAAGASVDTANADGNGPLLVAVQNADLEMVRLLIQYNAEPNNARIYLKRDGMQKEVTITPLIAALQAQRLDIAKVLLSAGADINYAVLNPGSQWLYTALGYAVYIRNTDQVKFLIDHGANVDCTDSRIDFFIERRYPKQIPLAQALINNDIAMANLLLESGANLHAKTLTASTIPHILAPRALPHIPAALAWLANQGVQMDIQNSEKKTPLALAARNNQIANARFLLSVGADPDLGLPYATESQNMTRLLLNARQP